MQSKAPEHALIFRPMSPDEMGDMLAVRLSLLNVILVRADIWERRDSKLIDRLVNMKQSVVYVH